MANRRDPDDPVSVDARALAAIDRMRSLIAAASEDAKPVMREELLRAIRLHRDRQVSLDELEAVLARWSSKN